MSDPDFWPKDRRGWARVKVPIWLNPVAALIRLAEEPEARFCSFCGRALETVERDAGFDPQTGKPRVDIFARCPLYATRGPFPVGHPTRPDPLDRGRRA